MLFLVITGLKIKSYFFFFFFFYYFGYSYVKHNKENGQSLNMNQKSCGIAKSKFPVKRKI